MLDGAPCVLTDGGGVLLHRLLNGDGALACGAVLGVDDQERGALSDSDTRAETTLCVDFAITVADECVPWAGARGVLSVCCH